MDKSEKSSVLKLTIIAFLSVVAVIFLIAHILSVPVSPHYLYLLLNLLILTVAVEAGFFSYLKPLDEMKPQVNDVVAPKVKEVVVLNEGKECYDEEMVLTTITKGDIEETIGRNVRVVEKSKSAKVVDSVVEAVKILKKCPSMPSLFFIGSDGEYEDEAELTSEFSEDEEEEENGLSEEELFTKAETFIGNFYKQLKIQREESWNKIHGFQRKTF